MKTFEIIGYNYSELNDAAKEKIKQWYLCDLDIHNDIFYEDIKNYLSEHFPKSDLQVCYSLASCQGDGLNIYGKLNLYDFLDKWEQDEKTKRTLKFYIDNSMYYYNFEQNNRYCYSCKFIDRKYISDAINEFITELPYNNITNIKTNLIHLFFNDLIDYFEELDNHFEKDGYNYLYNVDEDEIKEFYDINEYYFTKDGKMI
jgi:hypothetical protein